MHYLMSNPLAFLIIGLIVAVMVQRASAAYGFFDDFSGPIEPDSPDVQNIGASKTAFVDLPIGPTYLWSKVRFTIAGVAATRAQIRAQVTRIRVVADGDNKIDLSGSLMDGVMGFYRNGALLNGIVPIYYARPWHAFAENQDGPSYGSLGFDSFKMFIDLAAGATIDGIEVKHRTVAGSQLGAHVVSYALGRNFPATGLDNIIQLPFDPAYKLLAMHIDKDSSTLDKIELIVGAGDKGNVQLLSIKPWTLNSDYLDANQPRTVQSNFTHLDFLFRNRVKDILPENMTSVALKLTWNAAPNNYNIVFEEQRVARVKGASKAA